ncbi:hypothetical protein [Flavobacterium sp. 25HG05S-40]|uniref:hypothetical protein n=1 Tax=Flavobacterium sp. 25HG05S-40 TaxID=3458682 RepID=UPI004043BE20
MKSEQSNGKDNKAKDSAVVDNGFKNFQKELENAREYQAEHGVVRKSHGGFIFNFGDREPIGYKRKKN